MNHSLWEHRSFLETDVVIVGGGITGLSTAASLLEYDPSLRVTVLERGVLPTGASTKNAGFACFGSPTELLSDRKKMGSDGMIDLVKDRWFGLQKLTQRLGTDSIGYQQKGGFELFFDDSFYEVESFLKILNQELMSIMDGEVFHTLSKTELNNLGLSSKVKHAIYTPFEGQVDTGKMMRSLYHYCVKMGALILSGSLVTHHTTNSVTVNGSMKFKSKAVAFCTNAFASSLVEEEGDLIPGRGTVIAVKPEKKVSFTGSFHYNEGYNYFRNYEDLVIFGGGRNLAFEEETTTLFDQNEKIVKYLHQQLREVILPQNEYEVINMWSGIMAFGPVKKPIVKKIAEGIYVGIRLGGMGVAIGSQVGQELAQQIIKNEFK